MRLRRRRAERGALRPRPLRDAHFQRSEDNSGSAFAAGVPGTPSSLPRPTSRPGNGAGHNTRVTENITYQASRTVKKTRLPAGTVRRMSLAVLVDHELSWQKDKTGYQRVLVPRARTS